MRACLGTHACSAIGTRRAFICTTCCASREEPTSTRRAGTRSALCSMSCWRSMPPRARSAIAQLRRDDRALADDLTAPGSAVHEIEREHFLEGSVPRPAPEPTSQGQVVGSYTLDRLLGQGGMGTVWLAHRSDGRYEARVAIKLLNPALLGPGGIERFRREGSALGRLTHPNIARLIDAGVTPGGSTLSGARLRRRRDDQPLVRESRARLRARVRLFLDVLAAVAHAHAKLILHRDLKPSNILVTIRGPGEARRLRHREAARRRTARAPIAEPHADGGAGFHARVRGSGTGAGRRSDERDRRVCARRAALRTADRQAPDWSATSTRRSTGCAPSSIRSQHARATPSIG